MKSGERQVRLDHMRRPLALGLFVLLSACAEKPKPELPKPPPPVPFLEPVDIAQVAIGWEDLCIRLRNGRVMCKKDWRPPGATVTPRSFTPVPGIADASEISLGGRHACARLGLGSVSCWGRNAFGEVGAGPDPTRVPTQIEGVPQGAAEVRLDDRRSCARMVDGTVRCWGTLLTTTAKDLAFQQAHVAATAVPGLFKVLGIALAHDQLCARLVDGTVRCVEGSTPMEVTGLDHVMEITMSTVEGCARIVDGTVRCWPLERGKPVDKPVAIKNTSPSHEPPRAESVAGLGFVAQLASGRFHTCARRMNGEIWCWGANDYGQLGDGTRASRQSPAAVQGIHDAVDVSAGGDRTCARRANGVVLCWGRDLLDDPLFHALTGLPSPPGPPGEYDSLVPEALRVPEHAD